jgi:hypothetical protein
MNFSTMNFSTMNFSTMNFSTMNLKLKTPELKFLYNGMLQRISTTEDEKVHCYKVRVESLELKRVPPSPNPHIHSPLNNPVAV